MPDCIHLEREPRPARISRSELDYRRAVLLTTNRSLATIVCTRPLQRIFDASELPSGRTLPPDRQAALEEWLYRQQERFFELRRRFLTTKSLQELNKLARILPKLDDRLSTFCSGWLL